MGQFAMPALIALTAVSGVVQYKAQQDAGKVASAEAKLAARKEGDAARAREIERRRALVRSLASQNAQAGAYGIATEGSPRAIAYGDVTQFQNDLLTDTVNTKNQQNLYRTQGKNARASARIGGVTTLLDTAASTAALSYKGP